MIDEISMKKLENGKIEVRYGDEVKTFPDWNMAFNYAIERDKENGNTHER